MNGYVKVSLSMAALDNVYHVFFFEVALPRIALYFP